MKKLICITGMDGVGKSTLVKSLAKELSSVHVANIWDIMNGGIENIPFGSQKDVDEYLCALTPGSRLLFLAHALKYSIDRAMKTEKKIILLDGYYYKYFSTELVLGASEALVFSVIKEFPTPDLVINLNLTIEKTLNRKEFFSRYESGLSTHPDKHNFEKFQKEALKKWKYFDRTGWHVINSSNTADELLHETLQIIKQQ